MSAEVSDNLFRAEFERRFPSLSYDFIGVMEEIGKLGREKYGKNCIECRIKAGDLSRNSRIYRREIAEHSRAHFQEYIDGVRHDHYGTTKHQLGAAAFNPMMEFMLSDLGREQRAFGAAQKSDESLAA